MSVEAYLNGKKVEPGRFEEVNMCGSMFEQAKSIKDQIANGLKLRGLYPDFVDRIPEEPQPCCCEPDMTADKLLKKISKREAEYAANKAKYEAERDAPNELFRKLDDPYERARLQEGRETDIYVRMQISVVSLIRYLRKRILRTEIRSLRLSTKRVGRCRELDCRINLIGSRL